MRRLLVVLVVLLGLAVAADRGAVVLAQRQIADQVQRQEGLAQRPTVKLRGFPFLTQVARGRWDGGVIGLENLRGDRLRVQRLDVDLRGVRLALRTVLSGSVDAVPVDDVAGTALVSYPDVVAAAGIPGLEIRPRGSALELALPVRQFGQTVRLVVTAAVTVTSSGLRVTAGQVEGVSVPQSVVDLALAQLSGVLPLTHLPYGLRLTGVRVTQTALRLTASARNIVLRRTG